MHKVAIIMSIYINDTLENVKEATYSIIYQTYKYIDFYIVLDGKISEDIKEFLYSLEGKILLYEQPVNQGLAKSLNFLLNIILSKNYKYIARMDADDISVDSRIQKQVIFLEKEKDTDIVGSWAIEIDAKGNELFQKMMPTTNQECLNLFKKRDCLIHPTVMFRNSFFQKAGFYPENTYFGEDTMMWAQGFFNNCKFANIPEYLLFFRMDTDFFNRRRGWKHAKSIFQLRQKVIKMLDLGYISYIYALFYAILKLLPESFLNFAYKKLR